jgi:hypothetical protein
MAIRSEAQLETSDLMAEVRRYLNTVEAFRAEGSEPMWLTEERTREGGRGEWEPLRGRGSHRHHRRLAGG